MFVHRDAQFAADICKMYSFTEEIKNNTSEGCIKDEKAELQKPFE